MSSLPAGADRPAVDAARAVLAPLGERVVTGGSIGALTTYRVGGAAALTATVADLEELLLVGRAIAVSNLPVLVIGRGSNLLVSDTGFAGIAVLLDPAGFSDVSVDDEVVTAGAAVALPALARQTVEAGLTGFEWAVGVPGSLGGAVRMNAGGHGSDMAHALIDCRWVDLGDPVGEGTWSLDQLEYGYRRSAVRPAMVVTAARLGLRAGDAEAGRQTIRQIVRWRREHQPGGQNAGSVFANPPGDSAGRLIDSAGLKGRRYGSAMVSPKHANFIQADPDGRADDIKQLMAIVADTVQAIHGISLQPEVRMVGFGDNPKSQVESHTPAS